jgi:urease accessory protein
MARAIPSESPHTAVEPIRPGHLLATLALGFGRDGDTTRLLRREHYGPLRVQKALYPEGPSVAHAIIVHPPGGVVGGDELRITVSADAGAAALVSTPGAAKWYRSNGQVSRQQLTLQVASDAALEWLPQETIFFNDADVLLETNVNLQGNARYIGTDILCFGRRASGERFDQGRIRQHMRILRDGAPLWLEQGRLLGGSAQMRSPLGLAGHSVCANLVAVGLKLSPPLMQTLRERCMAVADGRGRFGATQMKSVLLVRYLGDSSEVARHLMLAAWQLLRPALLAREATELRIWNT